jgi:hypothetical protein
MIFTIIAEKKCYDYDDGYVKQATSQDEDLRGSKQSHDDLVTLDMVPEETNLNI